MRFVLALILLLSISPIASAQDREAGQTDLSSNWANEKGFAEITENRSKAEAFLKAIMPEETQKTPTAAPVNESTATGNR